jgi:S1-C subfamily serine protease
MNKENVSYEAMRQLSQGMADAVDTAASFTLLINARKRLPVSGVLVKPDLALSVDHGIEIEDNITMIDGNGNEVKAALVGRDPGSDLALLRLEKALPQVGTKSFEGSARVGFPVIAVGKPEPEGVQASFGIITSTGGGLRTMRGSVLDRYIATDATPYPGFSGGPLLSLTGEVIGINTSGLVGGLSLAIPMPIALDVAGQLEKYGKVKRGYLGIRSQKVDIQKTIRQSLNLQQENGLLLVGIEADGPAAKASLLIGDILINLAGRLITDQDDLYIALSGEVVAKPVVVNVLRGGVITPVTVLIGERD